MEPMIPGRGGHDFSSRVGSRPGFLRQMVARLQSSESCLVALMDGDAAPASGGDLEWGTVLFLLNHTHLVADEGVRLLALAFETVLVLEGVALPSTTLAQAHYALLAANRLVAPGDGTLLGTGAYELYDQLWLGAFFNLVRSIVEGRLFNDGRLPVPAPGDAPVAATPRHSRVTLALLSGWGTGEPAAAAVMQALDAIDPDLVVHLGDVYYSGTPASGPFEPGGEELAKLLAAWPARLAWRSFTLNSNHEMYSGALGYFEVLRSPATPFAAQGGCSMFAIRIGDWTVLGLDTAFYADPLGLYMYGSLTLPTSTQQTDWIARLQLDPSKVIVLTHHNGFDIACDPAQQGLYTPLWTQLRTALGGDPHAWYWGHVHNGVVYANPVAIGDFATTTRCRCLGHAALPYGFASALAGDPAIAWQAATVSGRGAELANGFAALSFELDASGTIVNIIEAFYDNLSPAPRYAACIHSAPGVA